MSGEDGELSVTVKCFSHVRSALGRGEIVLRLPRGASAGDAMRAVVALAREALEGLPLRVAVNQEFVESSRPLADGDELALIPPVQGG